MTLVLPSAVRVPEAVYLVILRILADNRGFAITICLN